MKTQAVALFLLAIARTGLQGQKPSEPEFPLTEDSKPRDGVPKNASDRAIGGSSSGAICAFTAA